MDASKRKTTERNNMSLKKYVKDNIHPLPASMIGNEEILGFEKYMISESPEYLDDILGSIDATDLVKAIREDNELDIDREIENMQNLIKYKLKEEMINFIDEIREEEAEEVDNGISNNDRLMQEHR